MKKAFWISYDLGIKGDYAGLYSFLDTVQARECGANLAFFQKDYGFSDYVDKIEAEIKKYVKISKTDRIYVIYVDSDSGKTKGKFLFGNRKRSPWEGYATAGTSTEEDIS